MPWVRSRTGLVQGNKFVTIIPLHDYCNVIPQSQFIAMFCDQTKTMSNYIRSLGALIVLQPTVKATHLSPNSI